MVLPCPRINIHVFIFQTVPKIFAVYTDVVKAIMGKSGVSYSCHELYIFNGRKCSTVSLGQGQY